MEATGNPSPGNVIVELSALEGQRPEEQRLLNGADQRVSSSAEQPGPIQVKSSGAGVVLSELPQSPVGF